MALFDGQIATAQKDVQSDITQLTTAIQAVVQAILDGYTIEIKAVKK
jgi:hypothetical protein